MTRCVRWWQLLAIDIGPWPEGEAVRASGLEAWRVGSTTKEGRGIMLLFAEEGRFVAMAEAIEALQQEPRRSYKIVGEWGDVEVRPGGGSGYTLIGGDGADAGPSQARAAATI